MKRITLSYADAAFLIRAALRWYETLADATRGTDLHAESVGYVKRVEALKARAELGKTVLEQMMEDAVSVPLYDIWKPGKKQDAE